MFDFTDNGIIAHFYDALSAFELKDSAAIRETGVRSDHDAVFVEESDDRSTD